MRLPVLSVVSLLVLAGCPEPTEKPEDTAPEDTGEPDTADTDSGDTAPDDETDIPDTDTGDTDDTDISDTDSGDTDTDSGDTDTDSGDTDTAVACTDHPDLDGDGFGDPTATTCDGVSNGDDCDDTDATVYPDAPERCDGQENDCAGDGVYDDGGACDVGLDDVTTTLLYGSTASMNASAVAPAGDLDGDGVPEVLVSSYLATYLVSGADALAASSVDLEADAVTLRSDTALPSYPWLVADAVADVDGDGQGELLLGDPNANYAPPYDYGGAAWIVRGMPGSGALNDLAAAHLTDSSAASGQAGYSVASLGDADGDGVGEVLVGVPYGEVGDGSAYVVSADVTGEIDLYTQAVRFSGADDGARAGMVVGSAGDVDGDGLGDALIAGPYASDRGANEGAVWLVRAPFAGTVDLSAADAVLWGGSANASYGTAVATLGDADGDGLDDFAVTATNGGRSGWVDVWSGTVRGSTSAASAPGRVQGAAMDGVGADVAGLGDIDGDGLGDLAVAATHYGGNGAVLLFQHGLAGTSATSEADVKLLQTERLGFAEVSSVGDLDGDGRPDLLFGTPADSRVGMYAGSASLVLGGDW